MSLATLRLAVRVLLRRKAFTAVSLFGITIALGVPIVAAAFLDHVFAAHPPEVYADRTLGSYFVKMSGPNSSSTGPAGWALLDGNLRNLPGVERVTVFSVPASVDSFVAGRRVTSYLKRADADFWRVMRFDFVEGGPFLDEDVAQGRRVAVINESTRRRFFGAASALGHDLELGTQTFRVIGVVKDVPILRFAPFSDVFVPLTTREDDWRAAIRGDLMALLVARSPDDFPGMRAELQSRLAALKLPDKRFDRVEVYLEGPFTAMAREIVGGPADSHPEALLAGIMGLLAVCFMLLPALNLVNLSASRILERASEIGVRKAFGASRRALVAQFVAENLVLTFVGAALALVVAASALTAVERSQLIPYASFHLNLRVFGWALGMATFFGVASGAWPAWRMARLHPVQALKGGRA